MATRTGQFLCAFAVLAAATVIGGCATAVPTVAPSPVPTASPTAALTGAPTATPTALPAVAPTGVPTATPKPPPMALTGVLGAGRQIHTATVLADGDVIVVGGFDFADLPLASASRFDSTTGKFARTGSMAAARGFHTATLLEDDRVLITGGGPAAWTNDDPYLASAELYDPTTGTFSATGDMTTPRENHTATLLLDGRVLIAGGEDDGDHAVATAEIYNPATGEFSATGLMGTARGYHTATLLLDGRVLIVGGNPANNASNTFIAEAEIYDPTTGEFSPTGAMNTVRSFHAATLLSDGRVLITGGADTKHDRPQAEIYDPTTGMFSVTGSVPTAPRVFTTATLLDDGHVLVAGGGADYATRNFLASAELFDPTAGTFSPTGSMSEARTWLQANLLSDGRVLVTGGYGDVAPLASAEIYDPTSGTFSPVL